MIIVRGVDAVVSYGGISHFIPIVLYAVAVVAPAYDFASFGCTAAVSFPTVGGDCAEVIAVRKGGVAEAEKGGTPEEDAARGLVHLLEFGADIEPFRVDSNYYVMKFTVPETFIGYGVNELKLDNEFGLKLLALKRAETLKNCLGISFIEHDVVNELPDNDQIQAGDQLVCYGRYQDFRKFWKTL